MELLDRAALRWRYHSQQSLAAWKPRLAGCLKFLSFSAIYIKNYYLRFSDRGRKVLESRSIADDDRIDQLEKQVKDAKYVAEEADRKYDEVNMHDDRGCMSFTSLGNSPAELSPHAPWFVMAMFSVVIFVIEMKALISVNLLFVKAVFAEAF